MRNLIKNKTKLYVLNYRGEIPTVDSDGNYTGEKTIAYYPAKRFEANVSGARGSSQSEVFGLDINYDKTIALSKYEFLKLKIDENSVFFIDTKPKYDGTTPLYDYRVEKKAETLNEVVIAVRKVRNND